ncbi:hypothetical protein ABG067_007981, partial [Albugo candida]
MPFVRGLVSDKVEFATEVLRLQQCLVTDGLLPVDVENCCAVENVEVTTTTRIRPAQVSNEQVVVINNDFVVIQLENYSLVNLCAAGPLIL